MFITVSHATIIFGDRTNERILFNVDRLKREPDTADFVPNASIGEDDGGFIEARDLARNGKRHKRIFRSHLDLSPAQRLFFERHGWVTYGYDIEFSRPKCVTTHDRVELFLWAYVSEFLPDALHVTTRFFEAPNYITHGGIALIADAFHVERGYKRQPATLHGVNVAEEIAWIARNQLIRELIEHALNAVAFDLDRFALTPADYANL